ncbi:MAG: hypothetical protein JW751_26585 [Polyangiaceae bacterium]|nr:hypothetical protein [Polyangiaceae bacterium]
MAHDDPFPPAPLARIHLRAPDGEVSCARDPRQDLVVYQVRGKVTYRQLKEALERAIDLGIAERVLWNVVGGDLTGLLLGDIEELVTDVLIGPLAPRKWAILTGTGPSLAVAAVVADVAAEDGLEARAKAFVHHERALEWLGIQEHPTIPAPPDGVLPDR